jgi:CubicO group peptidase (beta-lactamase class C family)
MKKIKLILVIFNLFLVVIFFSLIASSEGRKKEDKSLPPAEIKSDKLSKILQKTENMPFLKSLIIVKDGTTIVEEYMNGGREELYLDLKSASKSILSALVGIALQQNYLKSIDQKVMDFFPEYETNDLDPRIFDLTIEHLLTMKSGFNVIETANVYRSVYESSDWIREILNFPFKSNPGEKFNYLSFNTHLLSAIITKATAMSTLEYSKKVLFSPLHIDKVLWEKDPKGYYIGGWAMSLTALDMAKFGLLYLNNGKFDGKQIVPSEWVKQSIIRRSGMMSIYYYTFWKRTYGFGYLWWIRRINGHNDIPFASGHGGQKIAFMPDVKVVIVTQANSDVKGSVSGKQHRAINSLLFDNLAKYFLKHHGNL